MTQFKHKLTGEIVTVEKGKVIDMPARFLTDEWEEYEEPREYWYLDNLGDFFLDYENDDWVDKRREQIGNCFLSREEAELAVRKLKAWKRLKDKGFRFTGCCVPSDKGMCICYETGETWTMQDLQDFKTLFGGEE